MRVLHISIADGDFSAVGIDGHVVISNIRALGGTVDTHAVAQNIAHALGVAVNEIRMDGPRTADWTFESVLTKATKMNIGPAS